MSGGGIFAEWQSAAINHDGWKEAGSGGAPSAIGAAFTPYFRIIASTMMRRIMKRSRRFMAVFLNAGRPTSPSQ
jgi:hypothetical protein